MTPSGIWTFVRNGTALGKSSPAFRVSRLGAFAGPDALARWAAQLVVSIEAIAGRTLSLPFGGPGTVLLGVSFVNGATTVLPHYLGDAAGANGANVVALLGPARSLSAGAGLLSTWSADNQSVTLHALGTFIADVFLMVSPQ